LVAALALGALAGRIALATTAGLAMGCWIITTLFVDLRQRLRPGGDARGGAIERLRLLPRSVAGMMVAHLGVAAFALGVTMVKSYEIESDVRMGAGTVTSLAGYDFRMVSMQENVPGPNYVATLALLEVSRDGRDVATLHPQKRVYRVQQNPMTEAAVASNGLRDLYVSLGERLPGGDWVVRVQFKPFITWIWGGCLLMMLGGIVAASDPRYRTRQHTRTATFVAPDSAGAVAA
jgi:cytochrome c-type biogenesis protein CcmF